MAWSAEITSIARSNTEVVAEVVFTESATGEVYRRTLNGSGVNLEAVERIVDQTIAQLVTRDESFASLTTGPVGKPPVPTPEEQAAIDAANAFFNGDYAVLLKIATYAAPYDSDLIAARDRVKKDISNNPALINDSRFRKGF